MRTVLLLVLSNVFMTIAWYGHLTEVPYEFQVVTQLGYSFGVIQSCTM